MKDLNVGAREAAKRFLERRGYGIIGVNWECAAGKADLIAIDGDFLVFVEVGFRSGAEAGFPDEALDGERRARREMVALAFLAQYDTDERPIRFDDVRIVAVRPDRALIRHHINSMGADMACGLDETLPEVA